MKDSFGFARSVLSSKSRHVPLAISLLFLACSEDDGASSTDERTFDQQVEQGGELYLEHCADCHGESGEGTKKAPAVVGAGALPLEPPESRTVRSEDFETALDVFVFASETMPADDPGALTDAQLVDILAFALFANGVELEEPLGFDNASEVVINERN